MEKRIQSFDPIVDDQSEILILGSIPGNKSLEMQQYYAHPQNQFWKIIFHVLKGNFSSDYYERVAFLKSKHIALWDVIDTCERKGSLDTAIRNEEANDIAHFLEVHPNIKAIFCNGQKSFNNMKKILNNSTIPVYSLPSTSPAHTISFDVKLKAWEIIQDFLD